MVAHSFVCKSPNSPFANQEFAIFDFTRIGSDGLGHQSRESSNAIVGVLDYDDIIGINYICTDAGTFHSSGLHYRRPENKGGNGTLGPELVLWYVSILIQCCVLFMFF